MKSLSIYETENEFEILKNRVANGENIYTLLDGKVIKILSDGNAKLATKSEFKNLIAPFQNAEIEEDGEAEIEEKELGEEQLVAEDNKKYEELETRVSAIETVLSKPIFTKSGV